MYKSAELMEIKFDKFGLVVIDWQMTDTPVGIMEGWVIWRFGEGSDNKQEYELSWAEAIYMETLDEIVKESKEFIED